MIFDTSTIIALMKEEDFFKKYDIHGEISSTVISLYELLRGAVYLKLKTGSEKGINRLTQFFSEVPVLQLTEMSANISSLIYARLRKEGDTVNDADIMIASICIENNKKLVTKDKDFNKIRTVYPNFKLEILE